GLRARSRLQVVSWLSPPVATCAPTPTAPAPNPSPMDANGRLMFWAYAVDKDKWVIDSACALTTPVRLSSESSTFIETGKYQEIAALKTENLEYRVFQTVLNMKPERNS
ncbi:MAG: hypothetical protein L6437_15390, partial [Kiritimatiellae bacterium]|nr:hypothetical protein [Kiritimatiellia bacterium]